MSGMHISRQLTFILLVFYAVAVNEITSSSISSSSSVRFVRVPSQQLFQPAAGVGLSQPLVNSGLVKVVQSGHRYGGAQDNIYGSGSSGGYVHYDQLPSYYGNNAYTGESKGYVYYDQLPSYNGKNNGYTSYGNKGYVYYDQLPSYKDNNGYTSYGNQGYVYYDQLPSYKGYNGYGGDSYGEYDEYYYNSDDHYGYDRFNGYRHERRRQSKGRGERRSSKKGGGREHRSYDRHHSGGASHRRRDSDFGYYSGGY